MVKAMVGGCCVCSDERGWDENPLVYCDGHGCNVAVHQACYGIVQVPKGPWFCRKCESQERIARVKCELCPSKTGALKRTDTGGWAHVVCALYIPEVRFGNVTTMEPIILASVPHERYLKMCYICEERGKESKTAHGGCMNCNKQGCRQTFHVTCAQSCGFLCEENDGQSGNTVKYVGYCQFHWNKRSKGLLNIQKTPEKEKMKLKWEKDKKPKPRTSSENQPPVSQSQKLDSTPKSTPSASSSSLTPSAAPLTPTTVVALPGTPKPRGRKPSTVKTLPGNSSGGSTSSSIDEGQGKSSQEKESPGVVLSSPSVTTTASPVPTTIVASLVHATTISFSTTTTTASTVSVFAPIPTTASNNGDQVSLQNSAPIILQSIGQSTPTPPPVSTPVSKTVPQPKPTVVKKPANQTRNSQGPRKRPSSKTDDEPKRKVGRPPLKNKGTESKPKISRSNSTPKQPKPRSQSKSQEMKSPVINSPTPMNLSSSYPGYPMCSMAEMSSSSLISANSGMPPSTCHGVTPTPYVIPQPRLAGQLENGYSSQETNRRTSNGPLQLPSSLEQLLEYQWEQGAQFLMQQASQYDVASLMSSLHQLKADNTRLENRLESLVSRRSQLLQVSSRLAAPMSCTPTSTSTTSTDASTREPAGTRTTSSVTQSIPTATSRTPVVSTSDGSKYVSDAIEKTSPSATKLEPVPGVSKSQTPPSSTNSTVPGEDKPISLKTKNDKGKSSPIKGQNTSATVMTVPITSKMVPQKAVNVQPSQIKVSMVQPPHAVTQGVGENKKPKLASTASPIAILPTISSPLLQKQQLQLLQPQTKQMTQNKTSKQPHILPHQTITSQFATQQFPQQQQFVLLMQQQQHLQQQLQRQSQAAYQSSQNQLASSQAQANKGTAAQKFVPTPMSLGYQGGFVTISDGLGIGGQHIDVTKATAFATLPLVQLEKNKANDHLDKNGTASASDKSVLKNS